MLTHLFTIGASVAVSIVVLSGTFLTGMRVGKHREDVKIQSVLEGEAPPESLDLLVAPDKTLTPPRYSTTGIVTAVNSSTITVRDSSGVERTIFLNPKTAIRMKGDRRTKEERSQPVASGETALQEMGQDSATTLALSAASSSSQVILGASGSLKIPDQSALKKRALSSSKKEERQEKAARTEAAREMIRVGDEILGIGKPTDAGEIEVKYLRVIPVESPE